MYKYKAKDTYFLHYFAPTAISVPPTFPPFIAREVGLQFSSNYDEFFNDDRNCVTID